MSLELQEVADAPSRGPVEPDRLARSMLLAMRQGSECLEDFLRALMPGPFVHSTEWLRRGRAVEYSLDAAWREACALCLPLGEEVAKQVVTELVRLRYRLSAENTTSDSPPVDDLWSRVDLLLEYLDRLDGELEGLRGNENTPGAADLSVMLANLCALVLHSVKFDFQLTYVDVPWEEMEYLLVMYIEARSVFETVSYTVVTAERTVAHLRCFRELVKKHVLVHRDGPESELKKTRDDQKPAPPVGTMDNELARLQRDFSHLRDFNSLKEAAEALRVAQDALLDRTDDAWASYGWLALRWALFVVGERFKYSWLSPNLSPRWAVLVDAIAPGGIRKIMSTIRDDQEHAEEHSNSKTLAFVDMERTKRKELADELEKLRKACLVAVDEILLEKDYKSDSEETVDVRKIKVVNNTLHNDKNRIIEEVMNCLKPAASYAGEEFKHLTELISFSRTSIPLEPFHVDFSTKFRILDFSLKHKHVIDIDRVVFLLNSRSVENTARFQRRLEKVNKLFQGSAPMEKLIKALQDTPREPNAVGIFAVLGGVRELASRWHEEDTTVLTIIPFSPALFGRQLRNYLNHLDEVFSASNCLDPFSLNYPREILQLGFLFRCEGFEDIASQSGARPNPFDLQWSRNECERLLKLIKLKGDMFRHAREGHLEKLQHLVEERGGHVSARDRQNRTLMHAAAQGGQLPVVEWLLRTSAVDPLAEDWGGHTALDVAATGDVAQVLLQELPPASRKENVASSLINAALEGREEVVQVLLSAAPDVNAAYGGFITPLDAAAHGGHEQVVQLLMKAGARPHAGGPPDTHLTLKYAARSGSAATVRLLLDADPPPDPADCWAAARIAAARRHKEAFSALLHELVEQRSARDQPSWRDDLHRTLEAASCGGSSAIVSMLLDCAPAAMLAIRGTDSALWCAVTFDHTELSRDLIKRGADPLCDVGGVTALTCAAYGTSADTLRDLLHHARQHCPAEGLQRALQKALQLAAAAGRLEAVKMLVHHGADINGVVDGKTALGAAAALGQHEVVRWLLQQGADQLLGDPPALYMATVFGQHRIVELLVAPPQPSALRQAVMAREKGVLERVLQQFVTHLAHARGHAPARTPSRVSGSDRRRAEAENKRVLLWWRKRVLVVVQRVDKHGLTALHLAAATSSLPIVKHLLKTEEELLRQVYGKGNSTKTKQDGLTVYARGKVEVFQADKGLTALWWGVYFRCAPEVAEALLQRMSNEMWMALGGQTLPEVRVMAAEALVLAASTKFYSASTARALCWWISRSAEGLRATSGQPLLGAQGAQALEDIRRRAVAALDSARSEAVLVVLRPVLRPELLSALASFPFPDSPVTNMEPIDWMRVMAAWFVHLNLGKENCRDEVDEMAVQLLCVWLRDFTGTDPEAAVTRAACEALRICTVVQDRYWYDRVCRYLWNRWVRTWPRLRGGQRRALFMLFVLSELEEGYVNSESERVRWEQSKKKN